LSEQGLTSQQTQ